MPITALVGDSIFAVHGGLSPNINSIDQIRTLNRIIDPEGGSICDLLWSDPSDEDGWRPNGRGVGYYFGRDVSSMFVKENGIDVICRGHQVAMDVGRMD